MRIGIFGGSFNPPHKMHEHIAHVLLEQNFVDKIIFVPTGNKYQKKELIDGIYRYQMLKIIVSKNEQYEVSDYELKNELTYTYETLKHFEKQYPNDEIYFVLGADNLADIPNWKNYQYLLERYHFLVINRGNRKKELEQIFMEYQNHIHFVPMEEDSLSSTKIRYWVKAHDKEALFELDSDVLEYIAENKLYE